MHGDRFLKGKEARAKQPERWALAHLLARVETRMRYFILKYHTSPPPVNLGKEKRSREGEFALRAKHTGRGVLIAGPPLP